MKFYEEVQKAVAERMGEEFKVILHETTKNNGSAKNSLTILKKGDSMGPCIHLDGLENCFVDEVAEKCIRLYKQHKNSYSFEELPIHDAETFKKNVCVALVNTKMNKDMLEHVPHREFLDLSVIYKLLLPKEDCIGSVTIQNALLEHMGIDTDTLHACAMENTPAIMPAKVIPIQEMMKELLIEMGCPEILLDKELEFFEMGPKMFVISNKYRLYGASAMLWENTFEALSEQYGDLIVIPSSVDEIICVPVDPDFDLEEVIKDATNMVKHVNQEDLPKEKHLSDHAYIYRKGIGLTAHI